MSRLLLNALVILTILLTGFSAQCPGQIDRPSVYEKPITIHKQSVPFAAVIGSLISDYDLAFGLEVSTLDSELDDFEFGVNVRYVYPEPKPIKGRSVALNAIPKKYFFTLDFTDARLEDVMDAIVKQMKNYRWEIDDDIINIVPIVGRDSRFERMLNIRIKEFRFEKGEELTKLRQAVMDLPEIDQFLTENKLGYSGWSRYIPFSDHGIAYKLEFRNMSLKNLLNRITGFKRGGWIMKKSTVILSTNEKYFVDLEL